MINHLHLREATEERENSSLSPYAMQSRLSQGRQRLEEPDPIRTCFQRDRDRIIHSKSFRRLKHKTQVFIAPPGDHYVTRLTHTLEVSQIARTIARALRLNEDLVEAISLGHDLGHTPFGHVGEKVLNELHPGGFCHNEQSQRVVDFLEKSGQGLNLTLEVREGILQHSKTNMETLYGPDWGKASTFEGEVCKIADLVAYINHDIGDAIRAGMLTEADLPATTVKVLGSSHSVRINTMVTDIIEFSLGASGPGCGEATIGMSKTVREAAGTLREFLFDNVYNAKAMATEAAKAREIIYFLYRYFLEHEVELPIDILAYPADLPRHVADYVSGMTDQYAKALAEKLGMPSN